MSKEKLIEEMAEFLRHSCENECFRRRDGFIDCEACEACLLYDAGYRKQSEGEWVKVAAYNDGILNTAKCSVYGTYQPVRMWDYHPYCPFCGASMKGGAE